MDEIDEAAGRKGAGADALRFFFLSRSANSNVEFDIELAKKASLDNPVFYVQYGHARLCSILRKAAELGIAGRRTCPTSDWASSSHPDELAIAHKLGRVPRAWSPRPRRLREPHRIVFYVQELARDFQSYFTRLKGESDPILPPESVRAESGLGGEVGLRQDARAPRVDRGHPQRVRRGARARRRERPRADGSPGGGGRARPTRTLSRPANLAVASASAVRHGRQAP